MYIGNMSIQTSFCNETCLIRCRMFDDHVTIVYKDGDGIPYYLRVYRDGVFSYDFQTKNAWHNAIKELLAKSFYDAMRNWWN